MVHYCNKDKKMQIKIKILKEIREKIEVKIREAD